MGETDNIGLNEARILTMDALTASGATEAQAGPTAVALVAAEVIVVVVVDAVGHGGIVVDARHFGLVKRCDVTG